MHSRFLPYVQHLDAKFRSLLAMSPHTPASLPKQMCARGVYLLSEGRRHLYVGRSNHRMAALAFRLAREETGNLKATYKKGNGSRAGLIENRKFLKAFVKAKARIRNMSVRFVEEADPTRQALLEIYVSIVLRTPYNDFDTH